MQLVKPLATLAGTTALLVGTAVPAFANATVGTPTVDAGAGDLRPLSASGSAIVLARNANGTLNIAYNCVANGAGDIVAINVSCSLARNGVNLDSSSTTLPGAGGAASAAANAVLSAPGSGRYEVCFVATGYYVNGQSKSLPTGCSSLPVVT